MTFTPNTLALCFEKRSARFRPKKFEHDVPFKDDCPVATADAVCNLGGVGLVVHEQQLKFPDIVHEELLQAVRKKMAGLLVATITNLHRADQAMCTPTQMFRRLTDGIGV